MTLPHAVLLFGAALLGGALNAVAGGGSFFVFPTLIFTGVAPIRANATTTVALWPGSLASVGAYRAQFRSSQYTIVLGAVSLLGGALGAVLLLRTPQAAFERLLPYLLLSATLLFAVSPRLTAAMRATSARSAGPSRRGLAGVSLVQLVIAIYGGFFGGGIGILMLATLSLMGFKNIHTMNALKTLLASCINGVAVATFVVAGAVAWPQAVVMIAGGVIGGYAAAHYATKLPPAWVRRFVIAVGALMTLYFFITYR